MADIAYGALLNNKLSTRRGASCVRSLAWISTVKSPSAVCSLSGSTIEPMEVSKRRIFLSFHLSRSSSRIIVRPCLSGAARLGLVLTGIPTSENCTSFALKFRPVDLKLDFFASLIWSRYYSHLPCQLLRGEPPDALCFQLLWRPPLVVASRSLEYVPTTIHLSTMSSYVMPSPVSSTTILAFFPSLATKFSEGNGDIGRVRIVTILDQFEKRRRVAGDRFPP